MEGKTIEQAFAEAELEAGPLNRHARRVIGKVYTTRAHRMAVRRLKHLLALEPWSRKQLEKRDRDETQN